MIRAIRVSASLQDERELFQPLVHQALREYIAACEAYQPFDGEENPEMRFVASNGVTITVEAEQ